MNRWRNAALAGLVVLALAIAGCQNQGTQSVAPASIGASAPLLPSAAPSLGTGSSFAAGPSLAASPSLEPSSSP